MTDEEEIKKISKMSEWELLSWVMSFPESMTDGYYRKFRDAVNQRYQELLEEHSVTDVN